MVVILTFYVRITRDPLNELLWNIYHDRYILKKFLTEKGNDKETAQNVVWFKSNI